MNEYASDFLFFNNYEQEWKEFDDNEETWTPVYPRSVPKQIGLEETITTDEEYTNE